MIKSFACRDTEKLFNDQRALRFQAFERQARKRLMVLHAAPSIEAFPGIEKGNMLSVSISSGAYVSNGMTAMRTVLKLRTITEVFL